MVSFVPSREDWGYRHEGAFICGTALGGGVVMKWTAPLYPLVAFYLGFFIGLLTGGVMIAGHRTGHVPTKVLGGMAALALASMLWSILAFVLWYFIIGVG